MTKLLEEIEATKAQLGDAYTTQGGTAPVFKIARGMSINEGSDHPVGPRRDSTASQLDA